MGSEQISVRDWIAEEWEWDRTSPWCVRWKDTAEVIEGVYEYFPMRLGFSCFEYGPWHKQLCLFTWVVCEMVFNDIQSFDIRYIGWSGDSVLCYATRAFEAPATCKRGSPAITDLPMWEVWIRFVLATMSSSRLIGCIPMPRKSILRNKMEYLLCKKSESKKLQARFMPMTRTNITNQVISMIMKSHIHEMMREQTPQKMVSATRLRHRLDQTDKTRISRKAKRIPISRFIPLQHEGYVGLSWRIAQGFCNSDDCSPRVESCPEMRASLRVMHYYYFWQQVGRVILTAKSSKNML